MKTISYTRGALAILFLASLAQQAHAKSGWTCVKRGEPNPGNGILAVSHNNPYLNTGSDPYLNSFRSITRDPRDFMQDLLEEQYRSGGYGSVYKSRSYEALLQSSVYYEAQCNGIWANNKKFGDDSGGNALYGAVYATWGLCNRAITDPDGDVAKHSIECLPLPGGFEVGQTVYWNKVDDDVAFNDPGTVMGPTTNEDDERISIQFTNGTWTFKVDQILRQPRTLPGGFEVGQRVYWNRVDDDVAFNDPGTVMGPTTNAAFTGSDGISIQFTNGTWNFKVDQILRQPREEEKQEEKEQISNEYVSGDVIYYILRNNSEIQYGTKGTVIGAGAEEPQIRIVFLLDSQHQEKICYPADISKNAPLFRHEWENVEEHRFAVGTVEASEDVSSRASRSVAQTANSTDANSQRSASTSSRDDEATSKVDSQIGGKLGVSGWGVDANAEFQADNNEESSSINRQARSSDDQESSLQQRANDSRSSSANDNSRHNDHRNSGGENMCLRCKHCGEMWYTASGTAEEMNINDKFNDYEKKPCLPPQDKITKKELETIAKEDAELAALEREGRHALKRFAIAQKNQELMRHQQELARRLAEQNAPPGEGQNMSQTGRPQESKTLRDSGLVVKPVDKDGNCLPTAILRSARALVHRQPALKQLADAHLEQHQLRAFVVESILAMPAHEQAILGIEIDSDGQPIVEGLLDSGKWASREMDVLLPQVAKTWSLNVEIYNAATGRINRSLTNMLQFGQPGAEPLCLIYDGHSHYDAVAVGGAQPMTSTPMKSNWIIPGGYSRGDQVRSKINWVHAKGGALRIGDPGKVTGAHSSDTTRLMVKFVNSNEMPVSPSDIELKIIGEYEKLDRVRSMINWKYPNPDYPELSLAIGDQGTVIGMVDDKLSVHFDKYDEDENLLYGEDELSNIGLKVRNNVETMYPGDTTCQKTDVASCVIC